jgi:hypothetical protein
MTPAEKELRASQTNTQALTLAGIGTLTMLWIVGKPGGTEHINMPFKAVLLQMLLAILLALAIAVFMLVAISRRIPPRALQYGVIFSYSAVVAIVMIVVISYTNVSNAMAVPITTMYGLMIVGLLCGVQHFRMLLKPVK